MRPVIVVIIVGIILSNLGSAALVQRYLALDGRDVLVVGTQRCDTDTALFNDAAVVIAGAFGHCPVCRIKVWAPSELPFAIICWCF